MPSDTKIACKIHGTDWDFGCYECAWKEHLAKDTRRLLESTFDPEIVAVIENAAEDAVREFDSNHAAAEN